LFTGAEARRGHGLERVGVVDREERRRRTRRGERALERRTCGSSDWVARSKRGDGWVGEVKVARTRVPSVNPVLAGFTPLPLVFF